MNEDINNVEEVNIVEKLCSIDCDIEDSKRQIKSYQDMISTYRSDLKENRHKHDDKLIEYIETSIRSLEDTIRYLEMRIEFNKEEKQRWISSFNFKLEQDYNSWNYEKTKPQCHSSSILFKAI